MDIEYLGISLKSLDFFVISCEGEKSLAGLSTWDVCESFVKPQTTVAHSSYCEMLKSLNHPQAPVATATVYLCHTSKYKFLDVIHTLKSKYENEAETTFIWFDVFSINHHTNYLFDDSYFHKLRSLIKNIGNSLLVFAPWDDQIVLSRTWCLFELFCFSESQSKFEVAMRLEDERQLLLDILRDVEALLYMIHAINLHKSEATVEEDSLALQHYVKNHIIAHKFESSIMLLLAEWLTVMIKNFISEETDEAKLNELRYSLAMVYEKMHRNSEAEPLYVLQLEYLTRKFGESDARTLNVMNHLADLFVSHGDLAAAEPLYTKCLEKRKALFGAVNPATLVSMNNLGMLYRSQSRYQEAEALYLECLSLRKVLLGANHPNTLNTMNNLALVYEQQQRRAEAEELYSECLSLMRSSLGDDHTSTLASMFNLGIFYYHERKFLLAEALLDECMHTRKRKLGLKHPDTLQVMTSLVAVYKYQGKIEFAEKILTGYYEVLRENYGDNHPNTIVCMNNLASIHCKLKKFDSAESMYSRCIDASKITLGSSHPDTLSALAGLAGVYYDTGRYADAEPLYEQCYLLRRATLGEDQPDTLGTMNNLGALYFKMKQYQKAREYFTSSAEIASRAFGAENPITVTAKKSLEVIDAETSVGDDDASTKRERPASRNLVGFSNKIAPEV